MGGDKGQLEPFADWNHLQIDVLLGTDNYHLMYPEKEVVGGVGEPCARLCPLGWTAVGRINNMENTGADHNTCLCHTFRMQQFVEEIMGPGNYGNYTS